MSKHDEVPECDSVVCWKKHMFELWRIPCQQLKGLLAYHIKPFRICYAVFDNYIKCLTRKHVTKHKISFTMKLHTIYHTGNLRFAPIFRKKRYVTCCSLFVSRFTLVMYMYILSDVTMSYGNLRQWC